MVLATMGEFFLITGTGKTGTSWLAEALDHPKAGIVCWDEGKFPRPNRVRERLRRFRFLRQLWTRYRQGHQWLESVDNRFLGRDTWLDYAEYEVEHGLGPRFDEYFGAIESRMKRYAAVGDSHSWDPHTIPQVTERISVSRVIHLVRNGIPNVHALATHNAELFERSPIIRRQIDRYREIFGGECANSWEYWCFWWSINSLVPDWLRANLPDIPVDVYRLEDLTGHISHLEGIIESLNPGGLGNVSGLLKIQGKNDNRDQTGDQSPSDIWERWTDEQRSAFRRICGDAMEHYGYQMP